MKVYNIDDVDGFFKCIDKCKGQVLLVSEEGDKLNLKSQLSKVIAYANVFSGGKIKELELLCSDPDDMRNLYVYMNTGRESKLQPHEAKKD